MKQNIEVEVPDGMKAVYKDNKIEFVKIRSKSWEEFCENHPVVRGEWYATTYSQISQISQVYSGVREMPTDRNLFATEEDVEGNLALIQLTRLRDEWVGDWKPDWLSSIETKYYIRFLGKEQSSIGTTWKERRFLSFPTQKMAKEFLRCYEVLIKKAKRFI